MSSRPHTLVVRLDRMGDVVLTGPAVRAVAAGSRRVTFLAGPHGRAAARLLPGVDRVLEWRCPWIDQPAPPVRSDEVARLVRTIRALHVDRAVVLTSFHQSPLPTALLLRLAGVRWIGAVCEDYPGSLLDLRLPDPGDVPEAERALTIVAAAGFGLPHRDDGRLAVRVAADASGPRFDVVLHPGTSVPARAWPAEHWGELCRRLTAQGLQVAVTGSAAERSLVQQVSGTTTAVDLADRTPLPALAALLRASGVLVAANTGVAHLAAATHTPVVSLFAPTVPAVRWAPYRTACVVLGDQDAPCRDTRATQCPVPGHPCLTSVLPHDVVAAVDQMRATSHEPHGPPVHLGGAR
ncbi:MAG TPA: glycosyltransferase family 9 protein [Lapillicoccus sp.]|nr:glycosyltransferase family 9 protein [Lapillicoccus sp.]